MPLTTTAYESAPPSWWQQDPRFDPLTNTNVVGINKLMNVGWLTRAVELTATVARVDRTDGTKGTGFLVAPNLLLTNHHVLPDKQACEGAKALFDLEVTWSGDLKPVQTFGLDVDSWSGDADLDYALV